MLHGDPVEIANACQQCRLPQPCFVVQQPSQLELDTCLQSWHLNLIEIRCIIFFPHDSLFVGLA